MSTRIIVIIGISIAVVAGVYIFGKCAEKSNTGAKEDSSSRHNAA